MADLTQKINRIASNVAETYSVLESIGVPMPADTNSDNLPAIASSITKRTANDLSASGATVTVPGGYYAGQVTKDVSKATQATPKIEVSSTGLITASAEQSAGYVEEGATSATKQLAVQTEKTVTPGTSEKTAVAGGVYTTGAVKVAGDANLLPENIAEGVSIFGVLGEHSGGGSVDTCTVKVYNECFGLGLGLITWAFTTLQDGKISKMFYSSYSVEQDEYVFENVVCGSLFYLNYIGYSYVSTVNSENVEMLEFSSSDCWYQCNGSAGDICWITLVDDD